MLEQRNIMADMDCSNFPMPPHGKPPVRGIDLAALVKGVTSFKHPAMAWRPVRTSRNAYSRKHTSKPAPRATQQCQLL